MGTKAPVATVRADHATAVSMAGASTAPCVGGCSGYDPALLRLHQKPALLSIASLGVGERQTPNPLILNQGMLQEPLKGAMGGVRRQAGKDRIRLSLPSCSPAPAACPLPGGKVYNKDI